MIYWCFWVIYRSCDWCLVWLQIFRIRVNKDKREADKKVKRDQGRFSYQVGFITGELGLASMGRVQCGPSIFFILDSGCGSSLDRVWLLLLLNFGPFNPISIFQAALISTVYQVRIFVPHFGPGYIFFSLGLVWFYCFFVLGRRYKGRNLVIFSFLDHLFSVEPPQFYNTKSLSFAIICGTSWDLTIVTTVVLGHRKSRLAITWD